MNGYQKMQYLKQFDTDTANVIDLMVYYVAEGEEPIELAYDKAMYETFNDEEGQEKINNGIYPTVFFEDVEKHVNYIVEQMTL